MTGFLLWVLLILAAVGVECAYCRIRAAQGKPPYHRYSTTGRLYLPEDDHGPRE